LGAQASGTRLDAGGKTGKDGTGDGVEDVAELDTEFIEEDDIAWTDVDDDWTEVELGARELDNSVLERLMLEDEETPLHSPYAF
jgi:hypothetical protein